MKKNFLNPNRPAFHSNGSVYTPAGVASLNKQIEEGKYYCQDFHVSLSTKNSSCNYSSYEFYKINGEDIDFGNPAFVLLQFDN